METHDVVGNSVCHSWVGKKGWEREGEKERERERERGVEEKITFHSKEGDQ